MPGPHSANPPLFERLVPVPADVRRSWYPMLPVLGRSARTALQPQVDSCFLSEETVYTESGAAAIHLALRLSRIGQDDEVLVPSYHCPTMVWPVLAIGAVPVFVRVTPDLGVVLEELERVRSVRARALLLPHYFGKLQPELHRIKSWCDANRICLIEDCAHLFYGAADAELPGSVGHFAITSTRKFFPGAEGGALVANESPLQQTLPSASLRDEARCLFDTLQLAWKTGKDEFFQRGDTLIASADVRGTSYHFDRVEEARAKPATPAELRSAVARRQACRVTRRLIRATEHASSAAIRRSRWQRWHHVLSTMTAARPFAAALPSVAPYVYVARLVSPDRHFPLLKRRGIPCWRWDRLAQSGCDAGREAAVTLIQLPCHQSMSERSFEYLLDAFENCMTEME